LSPEEELARAQNAKRILDDDLFKEAVKAMRDQAMDAFKTAKPSDADALSQARTLYQVTEDFVNWFATKMAGGQIAQRRIDDAAKAKLIRDRE
jgi:hypothetical protein